MPGTGVTIRVASPEEIAIVRELWSEYWQSFGLLPDFQNFSTELAELPGKYASPDGRLLLARFDGLPAATGGFRRLDADSCEAKRVYVRNRFRGHGLGRSLLQTLITEARSAGYRTMYCDTLPVMAAALQMYRQAGFAEVDPYTSDPTPGAIFLKAVL